MGKYIIKNYPTYSECIIDECQDCTDYVIKQIVELCKHYKKYSDCSDYIIKGVKNEFFL